MKLSEEMLSKATVVSENCAVWLEHYAEGVTLLEADNAALKRENDAMRGALMDIAGHNIYNTIDDARDIARESLLKETE